MSTVCINVKKGKSVYLCSQLSALALDLSLLLFQTSTLLGHGLLRLLQLLDMLGVLVLCVIVSCVCVSEVSFKKQQTQCV